MRLDGEESQKATEDDSTVYGDRYEDDSQSRHTIDQIIQPNDKSLEIESLEKQIEEKMMMLQEAKEKNRDSI